MATNKDIEIRSGRTYTITDSVSGIDDWSDKEAVLTIGKTKGEVTLQKTGTIDSENDVISFDLTHEDTSDELTYSSYYYEITIYTDDKTFVKDSSYGRLNVKTVVDKDPTD